MKCPYCGSDQTRVLESRDADSGIRRRRQCEACGVRFTTYERIERDVLLVIKKDGRREPFDRVKILGGLRKACEKRPFPIGALEKLADDLEADLSRVGKAEIPSRLIGELVMERLAPLDQIAYIRFASVYREFKDLDTLRNEVDALAGGGELPRFSVVSTQPPLIPRDELEHLVRTPRRRRASQAS